jgi:uncharacterized protein YdgA (DUF945 family)
MNAKLIAAAAAAVVLLGGAVVAGATVTGTQARKKLQEAPLAWQAQWPMLKVVEQHYERGLFSATHTVTLQLGCEAGSPAAGGAPVLLTLVQRVKHGPLPGFSAVGAAVIDTELVLPEAARKAVAELTGNQPPLTAHTFVSLGGAAHTQITMPSFRMAGPEGQQLAWQGLVADVRDGGGTLRYELTMPGFTMAMRDPRMAMTMKLTGVHLQGEANGGASWWLRAGKAEGEIGAIELAVEAQGGQGVPPFKVALQQLRFSASNTIDKELLSNVAHLSGKGVFNDTQLDKIEMQASVRRLHAPAYERLMQHVMDTSSAACGMKQAVSPQVMLAQVQQDLMALLPFNPEYALDKLAVEIGGQRGELSYAFGVNGVTEADAALPLQALLMSKAQFRGQARLPTAWVENTLARFSGGASGDPAGQAEVMNVMLAKMTNDGFVVRDGAMLSTQFSLDKGQMLINGKPMGQPEAQAAK